MNADVMKAIEELICPFLEEPDIDMEEEATYETGLRDGRKEGKFELAAEIQGLINKSRSNRG